MMETYIELILFRKKRERLSKAPILVGPLHQKFPKKFEFRPLYTKMAKFGKKNLGTSLRKA
jgi:hypothetical protein